MQPRSRIGSMKMRLHGAWWTIRNTQPQVLRGLCDVTALLVLDGKVVRSLPSPAIDDDPLEADIQRETFVEHQVPLELTRAAGTGPEAMPVHPVCGHDLVGISNVPVQRGEYPQRPVAVRSRHIPRRQRPTSARPEDGRTATYEVMLQNVSKPRDLFYAAVGIRPRRGPVIIDNQRVMTRDRAPFVRLEKVDMPLQPQWIRPVIVAVQA